MNAAKPHNQMKTLKIQLLFITFFVVHGCSQNSKSQLILGEWEFVASYNLEKNKVIKKAKAEGPLFAIVKRELIELTDKENLEKKEIYYWKIRGDSLYVTKRNKKNTLPIFLKELDKNKLLVDLNFLGGTRVEFKRNTK